MDKKKFKEKYGEWAIVTGATNGIGKAFVDELSMLGLSIVIVGRNQKKLDELSRKLKSRGVNCLKLRIDLSLPKSSELLFKKTKKLDIGLIVMSAGFGNYGEFISNDISENSKMIDLHCKHRVEMSHYYGNIFKSKNRGGIINLSSIVAYQGTVSAVNYSAVNAFLQNFSEGLYLELKKHSVDLLSVCPGPVKTGFEKTAKMKFLISSNPKVVAKASLNSLGKKNTVFPGFIAKILHYSLHGLISRRLKVAVYNLAFKLLVRS